MTNDEIKTALKDVILRLNVAINLVHDGKDVPAFFKMQGIKDKLGDILWRLSREDEQGILINQLKQIVDEEK